MAPDKRNKARVYREIDQDGLNLASRFAFQCREGLACFNQCCRTATIMLSPYEVLRLSRSLDLTTREFLQHFTRREVEGLSHLPLTFIDLSRTMGGGCPFAGDQGCRVYSHRPGACRLFPITMGSRLAPQGMEDFYFCRKLEFCQGFAGGEEWTVASWRADQGFDEYDEARRPWLEILLKQGKQGQLQAEAGVFDLIFTLMYDLDVLRQLAGSPVFREIRALSGEELAAVRRDDAALLDFSCLLLTEALFSDDRLSLVHARLLETGEHPAGGAVT